MASLEASQCCQISLELKSCFPADFQINLPLTYRVMVRHRWSRSKMTRLSSRKPVARSSVTMQDFDSSLASWTGLTAPRTVTTFRTRLRPRWKRHLKSCPMSSVDIRRRAIRKAQGQAIDVLVYTNWEAHWYSRSRTTIRMTSTLSRVETSTKEARRTSWNSAKTITKSNESSC